MKKKHDKITIYCDGSCSPRVPGGDAVYGYIITDSNDRQLASHAEVIGVGEDTTWNLAVYSGVVVALEAAGIIAPKADVLIRTPARTIASQLSGDWRVRRVGGRGEILGKLRDMAHKNGSRFASVRYEYVPRSSSMMMKRVRNLCRNSHCKYAAHKRELQKQRNLVKKSVLLEPTQEKAVRDAAKKIVVHLQMLGPLETAFIISKVLQQIFEVRMGFDVGNGDTQRLIAEISDAIIYEKTGPFGPPPKKVNEPPQRQENPSEESAEGKPAEENLMFR